MKERQRLEELLQEQSDKTARLSVELDDTQHRMKAMQLEIDDAKAHSTIDS